ncbi:MAG TPA: DoxX family protein [Chloroflexi bacterium]|nr:DoxX family protein [Chloroflexota bacterium]
MGFLLGLVGTFLFILGTGGLELQGLNIELPGAGQALALLIGLILAIGAAVWLSRGYDPARDDVRVVQNPSFTQFLFESPRSAPLWLGVRLFLGLDWLLAGLHKLTDPGWMSGASLQAFWQRAIALPEQGRPAITYDWYRDFLGRLLSGGHQTWFAPLVAWGETLIGLALIIGLFVGIAAFFGAFMNMNFMLAGSASSNPILFTLAVLLILAWKVAGYYGLDQYVLPMLGAPWAPGPLTRRPSSTP